MINDRFLRETTFFFLHISHLVMIILVPFSSYFPLFSIHRISVAILHVESIYTIKKTCLWVIQVFIDGDKTDKFGFYCNFWDFSTSHNSKFYTVELERKCSFKCNFFKKNFIWIYLFFMVFKMITKHDFFRLYHEDLDYEWL